MKKLLAFLLLTSCRQPKQCTPVAPHYKDEANIFGRKVPVDFWIGASADVQDSTYLLGFTQQKIDSTLLELIYTNLSIREFVRKDQVVTITLYYNTTLPQKKEDSLKFGSLLGFEVWHEHYNQMWCTLFRYTEDSTKTMIFGKPLSENHRWNYNHYRAASIVKGCRNCAPVISAIILNNPDQNEVRIETLRKGSSAHYTDTLSYYFEQLSK